MSWIWCQQPKAMSFCRHKCALRPEGGEGICWALARSPELKARNTAKQFCLCPEEVSGLHCKAVLISEQVSCFPQDIYYLYAPLFQQGGLKSCQVLCPSTKD